jgi:hypothetical protein
MSMEVLRDNHIGYLCEESLVKELLEDKIQFPSL